MSPDPLDRELLGSRVRSQAAGDPRKGGHGSAGMSVPTTRLSLPDLAYPGSSPISGVAAGAGW